jgi:hypothetical protein
MLKIRALTSFTVCCIGASLGIHAEGLPPLPNSKMVFNFKPIQNRNGVEVFAACGVGNLRIGIGAKGDQMCDDNQGGPGSFKERYVHDGYIPNSTLYLHEQQGDMFHQVLIDETQNWKMEIYIATPQGTAGKTQARPMSAGTNDGHVYPIDPKNPEITGTGSGDPRRVQWRMVVNEPSFNLDMLKDNWDKKPKITQVVTDKDISSTLVIDMTNSSYSQMSIPAIVTNTTMVKGATSFQFDSRDTNGASITGGRFMITGYVDNDDPTYKYADAPKDYGKNLNWLDYWHGSQYWQPGDPYGYSGSFSEGSDAGWGN